MKVSELIGLDKAVERLVEIYVRNKLLSRTEIKDSIKLAVESYKDDVYANMKSIEQFKYKQIELDTKLDNLTTFCKAKNKKGG